MTPRPSPWPVPCAPPAPPAAHGDTRRCSSARTRRPSSSPRCSDAWGSPIASVAGGRSSTSRPCVTHFAVRAVPRRASPSWHEDLTERVADDEALCTLVEFGAQLLAAQPTAPATALPGWVTATVREDVSTHRDAVDVLSFHAAKGSSGRSCTWRASRRATCHRRRCATRRPWPRSNACSTWPPAEPGASSSSPGPAAVGSARVTSHDPRHGGSAPSSRPSPTSVRPRSHARPAPRSPQPVPVPRRLGPPRRLASAGGTRRVGATRRGAARRRAGAGRRRGATWARRASCRQGSGSDQGRALRRRDARGPGG